MSAQGLQSVSNNRKQRFVSECADILILAAFVLRTIPERLVESWMVGKINVITVVCAGAFCLCVADRILDRKPVSPRGWMSVACLIYMLCVGFAFDGETKITALSLGADSVVAAGYACGVLIGDGRESDRPRRLLSKLWILALAASAITQAGFLTGQIQPSFVGARIGSASLFASAAFLIILTPSQVRWSSMSPRLATVLSAFSVCILYWIALTSATRSIALLTGVVGVICLWNMRWSHQYVIVAACLIGIVLFIARDRIENTLASELVFQRLASTEVSNELRFSELVDDLEVAKEYAATGMGLGSQFYTNVEGVDLALGPHITFFNFAMKGGIMCWFVLLLVPLGKDLWYLLAKKLQRRPLSGGVVLYCALSAISGGWSFQHLFLLSVFSYAQQVTDRK